MYEGLNNSQHHHPESNTADVISSGDTMRPSPSSSSSAYTRAVIAQLRENPLTGRFAPDFTQVSFEEYGRIRIGGLTDRERLARAVIEKDEKRIREEVLWGPFSEVLEEDRWRRRMALRAEMLAFEKQCEREHDGTEGLSLVEEQERLDIYKQWLSEYKRVLPRQKEFRKSSLEAAAAAHAAVIGEAKMDQWLRVVVLDHVNLQDALLREERRAREGIIWGGLMRSYATELISRMNLALNLPLANEEGNLGALTRPVSRRMVANQACASAKGGNSEEKEDFAVHNDNDSAVDDPLSISADSLYEALQTERQRILLACEDEPFHRQRIVREEIGERLQATMPYGSTRMLKLRETLGREELESLEAYERHRGGILSALRQLQYDLWWSAVKAEGVPRRWRGEDLGSEEGVRRAPL